MNAPTTPVLAVMLGLALVPSSARAQGRTPDLGQLSIEDLMNVEITSASRKEQRTGDVAAAVFVISQDDILRSGMTSIPDVLRLAPGVDVAQINANKWAVSVRGFNGLYANKLLVLVDGRTVYNRIFAGVYWDTEDLMLDDIDRIEVIRGPSAATWGANAVNGVINIVTKTAADTQGAFVRTDGGRSGEQGAARYGGTLGSATFRVYSQWTHREGSLLVPGGTTADDGSQSLTAGFRADWSTSPDAFALEGDLTGVRSRALWANFDPQTAAGQPFVDDPSDGQGGHVLGRWTRTRAGGAKLQVQSFLDFETRHEPVGDYDHQVLDVDAQYETAFGARQDLVFGAGYRFTDEGFNGHLGFSLTPDEDRTSRVSAFLQDEIALFGNRVAVTLGTQMQYDANVGTGVQPTARVMWKAIPRQRVWASVSSALRTPSLYEQGLHLDYPPMPSPIGLPLFVTVLGNPAAQDEKLVDAEAGYRLELTKGSIDVTGFVGRYDHLQTQEPSAPVAQFVPSPRLVVTTQFGNLLAASTRGFEIAGHWAPIPAWRFDGSYTAFHITPDLAATSLSTSGAQEDGSAPRAQWQLRTSFSPSKRATVNVAAFHVGAIDLLQVAAYTRADANVEWRCTSHLSVTAIGQNIFDPAHAEFTGVNALLQATEVARSGSLRLRWTF